MGNVENTSDSQAERIAAGQREQLLQLALERNWGTCFILVGWLHLLAFSYCYYLESHRFHVPVVYLLVWIAELIGVWVIFRLAAGRRPAAAVPNALELFVRRVWIAYFVLAFNLASMNTLRGHVLFELFPAMASLASFAFIMMSVVLSWRCFAAVLVMFSAGLLMAANLLHAYLIFGLAWWLVLNAIGLDLWRRERQQQSAEAVRFE